MTILIVEDKPEVADLWKRLLAPIGADIREATTIPEALEMMAMIPMPELVLLDLRLPGSTAQNTLEHIAHLKEINPAAVVVILTGSSYMLNAPLAVIAKKFGADGSAIKTETTTQNELLSVIKSSLKSRRATTEPIFEGSLSLFERLSSIMTPTTPVV